MIYVKNLNFDPVEICLTFRSYPGNSSSKNFLLEWGLNMGLAITSFESAKIKLFPLNISHHFGQQSELFSSIGYHYKRHVK